MPQRKARITRKTKETDIDLSIGLDRPGKVLARTTIPFLDHMLDLFANHGRFALTVKASGDTEIDDHHLVEDIGIVLGQAIHKALGRKERINRYGNFLLPMDEALSYVALDISGRPYLDYKVSFADKGEKFDYDLLQDFFTAVAQNAGITLHVDLKRGRNNHHVAESIFKGFGRALAQAVAINAKQKGIPSTKGRL